MVVFSKNPIYSVLYLVITFFSVGGHYLILSAEFLFAVHIIVYAGAIMVLFLYVIMLLNLNKDTEPQKEAVYKVAAIMSGGLLMLVLVAALKGAEAEQLQLGVNTEIGLVKNLGKMLFNEFLLRTTRTPCNLSRADPFPARKTRQRRARKKTERMNMLQVRPANDAAVC